MEVSLQNTYLGFCAAHAITFLSCDYFQRSVCYNCLTYPYLEVHYTKQFGDEVNFYSVDSWPFVKFFQIGAKLGFAS